MWVLLGARVLLIKWVITCIHTYIHTYTPLLLDSFVTTHSESGIRCKVEHFKYTYEEPYSMVQGPKPKCTNPEGTKDNFLI